MIRAAAASPVTRPPAPLHWSTRTFRTRACIQMPTPPIEIDARRRPPLGMPPARFLRDYWQKRPLLIRAAFPGLESPLQPEDLAGLACEELALSRLIEHDRAGDRWRVRSGPFAEAVFPALPRQDWTLLVQDVDKWDPDVRALLSRFDFLPRWRIDDIMVSFAAPGGSVGAHVDQYDVFLLQAQGHRRWRIDARPNPPSAFRPDVDLKLLQQFDPSHDWVLGPGDMLYLPPGVPHHGVAEDACLTFSVGMRAPSLAEMVGALADELADRLPEALRYTDPDLQPARDPAEIDAASLDHLRGTLRSALALDDADLADVIGRFLTRYRSAAESLAPPRPPTPAQVAERLARGARLVRHPFARLAWCREGRRARLFGHGASWPVPLAFARRICADPPIDAGSHTALRGQAPTVVDALVAAGLLTLTRPRRGAP